MKRKGNKKAQKAEDDSNGVEDQVEENGGASELEENDVEEEPKDKKRKASKSNKRNVSFSKKGENATTESDPFEDVEDIKKSKEKQKKKGKESKVESSEEDAQDEDDESQYEVQKVLDEKMIKGVRHYLIRWKGYEEESDTWEPEDTLNCQEIINEFKESKKKQKTKKEKTTNKKEKKDADSGDDWDENEDFEVDKILEVHHKRDGKREFLVSWKGYAAKDNSWEPEENMNCKDLIEKFMAKVEKAKLFDDRDLRVNRKRVQRLTYNTPDSHRRLSRRMSGKERVQYHDTE